MVWAGSVRCPNCGSPLDTDASVCPYCYSSSPSAAPWQSGGLGGGPWAWIPIFAGLGAISAALVSDALFQTRLTAWLLEAIARLGESQ